MLDASAAGDEKMELLKLKPVKDSVGLPTVISEALVGVEFGKGEYGKVL